MKMKHKRVMKRIVAGIFALLMAYVASFGCWVVFPFAVGFVLLQILSWRSKNTPDDAYTGGRPLAFDYSVISVIVMSAIAVFLSNATAAILIFAFGITGVVLSYQLTKVETNVKKKKKKR